MNDLEELKIYKSYYDMMFYFYNLIMKFPLAEYNVLVSDIKSTLNDGIKCVIYAQKSFNNKERLVYLHKLDASLKTLEIYIRISYRKKYISSKNYGASCRKIADVCKLLYGWMKTCVKR